MSVEQNKLGEFYADELVMPDGSAHPLEDLKKWLADQIADPNVPDVVKVDYHEIAGEGDFVLARQTNHTSDGSKLEGVTVAHFKDGKIVKTLWYTQQPGA